MGVRHVTPHQSTTSGFKMRSVWYLQAFLSGGGGCNSCHCNSSPANDLGSPTNMMFSSEQGSHLQLTTAFPHRAEQHGDVRGLGLDRPRRTSLRVLAVLRYYNLGRPNNFKPRVGRTVRGSRHVHWCRRRGLESGGFCAGPARHQTRGVPAWQASAAVTARSQAHSASPGACPGPLMSLSQKGPERPESFATKRSTPRRNRSIKYLWEEISKVHCFPLIHLQEWVMSCCTTFSPSAHHCVCGFDSRARTSWCGYPLQSFGALFCCPCVSVQAEFGTPAPLHRWGAALFPRRCLLCSRVGQEAWWVPTGPLSTPALLFPSYKPCPLRRLQITFCAGAVHNTCTPTGTGVCAATEHAASPKHAHAQHGLHGGLQPQAATLG